MSVTFQSIESLTPDHRGSTKYEKTCHTIPEKNKIHDVLLFTCSQSKRHSRDSSKLNFKNVTFKTLFSSVLMSQAHIELCGYESDSGYLSVPFTEFSTPPHERDCN